MLEAKLGLFEVIRVDPDEGYVYFKEVFTGDEYTIIDMGLSGDRNPGAYYLYTRIITYHGISFGTGLNFLFEKKDRFIQEHIRSHKTGYTPAGEFVRFIQLYNRYSKHPTSVKIVSNTF